MKAQKKQKQQVKINTDGNSLKNYLQNYNIFQLILITIRLLPVTVIMGFVILFHDYIKPNIMIPSIRRYLSCLINLIAIRLVMILLGIFKFECESYRYFDMKASKMMVYRSGWVGVASYNNFIDFLYFSHLFNPVFTRVIEYHDEKNNNCVKLFYTPLTFKQACFSALNYKGFDTIIIRSQYELKKYKGRKMLLPTLISQCFEQINGPILIFIPSQKPKHQRPLPKLLGEDMFDNQKKYSRSGIIFMTTTSQIQIKRQNKQIKQIKSVPKFCEIGFDNQIQFLCQVTSELKMNLVSIVAIQIIKYKLCYQREGYAQFIDEEYKKNGYVIQKISYSELTRKKKKQPNAIKKQNNTQLVNFYEQQNNMKQI